MQFKTMNAVLAVMVLLPFASMEAAAPARPSAGANVLASLKSQVAAHPTYVAGAAGVAAGAVVTYGAYRYFGNAGSKKKDATRGNKESAKKTDAKGKGGAASARQALKIDAPTVEDHAAVQEALEDGRYSPRTTRVLGTALAQVDTAAGHIHQQDKTIQILEVRLHEARGNYGNILRRADGLLQKDDSLDGARLLARLSDIHHPMGPLAAAEAETAAARREAQAARAAAAASANGHRSASPFAPSRRMIGGGGTSSAGTTNGTSTHADGDLEVGGGGGGGGSAAVVVGAADRRVIV